MFKKMFQQKRKEQIKEFEKQEKRIKELKAHGQSKKAAVSIPFYNFWFRFARIYNEILFYFSGKETKR